MRLNLVTQVRPSVIVSSMHHPWEYKITGRLLTIDWA